MLCMFEGSVGFMGPVSTQGSLEFRKKGMDLNKENVHRDESMAEGL